MSQGEDDSRSRRRRGRTGETVRVVLVAGVNAGGRALALRQPRKLAPWWWCFNVVAGGAGGVNGGPFAMASSGNEGASDSEPQAGRAGVRCGRREDSRERGRPQNESSGHAQRRKSEDSTPRDSPIPCAAGRGQRERSSAAVGFIVPAPLSKEAGPRAPRRRPPLDDAGDRLRGGPSAALPKGASARASSATLP